VVKRDVVRLVTPGTLTEDSLLDARRHNFLAAYAEIRGGGAFAWTDISTGAFHVLPLSPETLGTHLSRIQPRELIVVQASEADLRLIADETNTALTPLSRAAFDSAGALTRLCAVFSVQTLDAFGEFSRPEIAAMGAVLEYLEITQKGKVPRLHPPVQETQTSVMQIDAATRRNLELTRALSGGRAGSLLASVDQTLTAGGGRLLETRISSPSCDLDMIQSRLDAVEYMTQETRLCDDMRSSLSQVPDLERALSRLALDRGGPRDLAAIRNGLTQAQVLSGQISDQALPDLLREIGKDMTKKSDLLDLLDQALVAEPPVLSRDGGFIADGYNSELEEARHLRDEGRSVIAAMQADLQALDTCFLCQIS
ncbi:MAG: DNA mismatch repair protein MutS, partial [Pseudomonadota bacterium]